MASPQLQDGYTRIANELLEALCYLHLSGNEWSFIHALIRKTYGYNKKEDWITNTQIMEATGLVKERVSEAKKKLLARGVITENRNKISLNKNYEAWGELRKSVTIVTEKRNSELRKSVTTIDSKETVTKDTRGEGVDNQKGLVVKNDILVDMANHNPLGAEIIHELIKVDPKNKNYYSNKPQRLACDFLLEEYGLDD